MDESVRIALEKQNPWWFQRRYDTGIPRLQYYPQLEKYMKTSEILLMLGARRTGKSTLLFQLVSSLKVDAEAILFINMDQPLFQSKADDPTFLGNLIEEYLLQHSGIKKFYVFIDEIQNYTYWVQTMKVIHDMNKQIKCILTGSTSALLKDAASTRLSGRYLVSTICPLSFVEFLQFSDVQKPSVLQKKQLVSKYLQFGGFPRVVLEHDTGMKQEILKNYFQTIYLKDIVYPHRLRNNKDVFDLLYFVLSNVGRPFSFAKMAKTMGVATDTVKEYVFYAEQSYLLHAVYKYDFSVHKQLVNPRKLYCVDTGLVNAVSFQFSENKGMLIENLVFTHLVRQQKEIFYHREFYECDFLICENKKIVQAIQVTVSLKDGDVKKREFKGLIEAMKAHKLKEGFIITESEKESLEVDGLKIQVIPLYEWLG